ncbi:hypothetical protein [Phytoactinopolyspora endophytica]|uniref:hypothetical protein n=1 Tax=Phytoactinopolyspora endophytica TaxID=1642495 RepID=UPI00101D4E07|nr:hypothetical protein [Phytoactinopolyspora endophytica]
MNITKDEAPTSAEDLGTPEGVPLTGATGLRLVDGNMLVDLDQGERSKITGLPEGGDRWVEAHEVGHRTVLTVGCALECDDPNQVFVLSEDATEAMRIASDVVMAPAPDGIWVTTYETDDICTLAKIGLDGRTMTPARAIDCAVTVREETPLGLLVWIDGRGDAILDPADLSEPVREDGTIHAVVGTRMVVTGGEGFAVVESDGSSTTVEAPESVGRPYDGRVSPDGRYVAFSYQHPAWPGPRQRLDVWVLDLNKMEWAQVPSMPVAAALKVTTEFWAPDGRLMLLGSFEERHLLAAWRPGESELAIREVTLPEHGAEPVTVW